MEAGARSGRRDLGKFRPEPGPRGVNGSERSFVKPEAESWLSAGRVAQRELRGSQRWGGMKLARKCAEFIVIRFFVACLSLRID